MWLRRSTTVITTEVSEITVIRRIKHSSTKANAAGPIEAVDVRPKLLEEIKPNCAAHDGGGDPEEKKCDV